MKTESRYSGKRAVQGCSLSLAIMTASIFLLSLVLNKWFGLAYSDIQKIVHFVIWLLAISAGGYFAARLGKTTGWTNSLVVGLLAAIFFLASGWNRISSGEITGAPNEFWLLLAACLLSVPSAVLGGVLWDWTSKTSDQSIGSGSDPKSETDKSADTTEPQD